jgi:hypothetical protein
MLPLTFRHMHQSTLVLQGDSVPFSTDFSQHKIPMRGKEFKQNTLNSADYSVYKNADSLAIDYLCYLLKQRESVYTFVTHHLIEGNEFPVLSTRHKNISKKKKTVPHKHFQSQYYIHIVRPA